MELNGEVQLPETFIEKIDKCFGMFNKILKSEEIINAIKTEVNLATKHGIVLPYDMINGTIARGEEIIAEARKEFNITFRQDWETLIKREFGEMELSGTNLGDSWKIQQFTDLFMTRLRNDLNKLIEDLGKMLSGRRYNKWFNTYYSKKY